MRIILSITLIQIFIASCSTSSGHEKEALPQNQVYKPGAAPADQSPVIPLPFLSKKKRKNTLISGQSLFIHNDYEYPVRYTKIELYSNKKKVFSTSTDNSGIFTIFTYLNDCHYTLIIDSTSYKAVHKVKIHGLHNTGIKMIVNKVN